MRRRVNTINISKGRQPWLF